MSDPILTCSVCGKLVPLETAHTDGDGHAVHEACYAKIVSYVAVSPMTLACPRCLAEPGVVCLVLLGDGIEVVHLERVEAAIKMDVASRGDLN